jgi:hypothetical protein
VSTTLVPPSYYLVDPRGRPARLYNTLSEVAVAIYLLTPTPATVSALTGSRRRSLTDAELHDLGRNLRAVRLHADAATPAAAVTSVHERRVLRR